MLASHFIIFLLFIHFLADFVGQSDKVALNKSKSWTVLATHAIQYSTVFLVALVSLALFMVGEVGSWILMFVAINGIGHFLTDAVTSRVSARLYLSEKRHWFFVVIGADQFIHSVMLIITNEII